MFQSPLRVFAGVLATLAVTACMTGGGQSELTSCTYPDSIRTPAPGFICGEGVEGFPLTRLTSMPDSDASVEARLDEGRMAVQNRLVLEWTQAWYADLPAAERSRAQALIYDWLGQELRVIRTRTSPGGSLWLLVGLSRSADQAHQELDRRLIAAGILPPSTEQDRP